MKKLAAACVWVLIHGFSPAWAGDPEQCLKQFQAESKALSDRYAALSREMSELSRAKADTKADQDARRDRANAINKQMDDIHKQQNEAARRTGTCMGGPASPEEAAQRQREFEERTAKLDQQLQAAAKKYEAVQHEALAAAAAGGQPMMGEGGLFAMPALPGGDAPPPAAPTAVPGFGSSAGKTPAQKAAALAAVNTELNRMPYLLPKKADAPSEDAILALASARHAEAKKSFRPAELSAYSRAVSWVPRFDGRSRDASKARAFSLPVAAVTNYFDVPRFMIAFAAAVFALDPQSPAAASNLASAIATAGERLSPGAASLARDSALLPYRRDAEACLRYALARSMKGEAYTDASLTPLLNLGHLYLDLGKREEARSLFQVARKQSPYNWDAALAMAAYFTTVQKPEKAQAVLDDEDLDRPQILMVARKHARALEKSDEVPPDSPDKAYQDNLKAVNSEPMATSADFMSQVDQSARNKLRYFVEHLAPAGSFTAPSIKKLTQYSTLQAISKPPGRSAFKDFSEMLQAYMLSSFASQADEQLKMLDRLGLKIQTGIDFDDVARNPQKYANQKGKRRPRVKVDKRELMANLERWKKDAEAARRDLATGKTGKAVALAAEFDSFFAILEVDPEEWADPMNVIVQKHNFAVHNRKRNLYTGYLFTLNKRLRSQFAVIAENYNRKVSDAEKVRDAELAALEARRVPGAEGLILKHQIHVKFFNTANNAAETAFGSATNVASTTYVDKIKPTAEAFYYDVIRHVGLISDPDVRDRKDAELKQAIYSALVVALSTVQAAHGSFKYHPEWECGCNLGALLQQREAEEKAQKDEEWARLQRNKAARVVFESGEMPRSSQLWKRLDDYGFDFDYFFITGRMSCARTKVKLKVPLPGGPEVFLQSDWNEFGGAAIHDQGIKLTKEFTVTKEVPGSEGTRERKSPAKAFLELKANQTVDGQGVVKDWSVTAATGLEVEVSGMTAQIGGQLKYSPRGFESDFCKGVEKEFKEQLVGAAGEESFEAISKLGSLAAGKVAQKIFRPDPAEAGDAPKPDEAKAPPGKLVQKEIWSGKFE